MSVLNLPSESKGGDGSGNDSESHEGGSAIVFCVGCSQSSTVGESSLVEWHHNPVVSVLLHLGGKRLDLVGADGLHLLYDGPLDALSAGWGSEGSIVAPVVSLVDAGQKSGDVDKGFG